MNNPDTLKIYENMGASLAHRVSRQPYAGAFSTFHYCTIYYSQKAPKNN